MQIGKMKITQAYPYLKSISLAYGLRLNRARELKYARLLLANLYCRELI